MAHRKPVGRAVSALWKLLAGHDPSCSCSECKARDAVVVGVELVTDASSRAAKGASDALTRAGGVAGLAAKVKRRRLEPTVTVDGVPARASFVKVKGK